MHTEFEARILDINHDDIIAKLESLGAEKIFDSLQQRYVYDFKPVEKNRWIRLRTNGTKTLLTIKQIEDKTIDGTKELEVEVSDFAKMNCILEELGYKNKGFQQNKRTRYMLNGVEIDLDRWPLIPEYLEIEGNSEEEVYSTIELLGFKKEDAVTLDVASIYTYYGYDGEHLADLNFEMEKKK